MARLSALKPQLGALPPRIAKATDDHGHSKTVEPWRPWYSTKRWRQLRWTVLTRDRFTCATCGRLEGRSPHLVADHKTPHRGDEGLFWDPENLQTLCKPCHDSAKQREERRGRSSEIGR